MNAHLCDEALKCNHFILIRKKNEILQIFFALCSINLKENSNFAPQNNLRTKKMAEESQNVGQLEQIGESVSKIEKFFEDNKKTITIVVVVVAVLICGFFAYKNLYLVKQQDKALAAMWQAQRAFDQDSFQIALYGNENITGFVDIIDEYSNTKAGNTAYYYAGCCAMKLADSTHKEYYEDAVKYLKKFSTDDPILEPLSIGLLGDAYCELNELDKAVSKYEKAAKVADDEMISPLFLSKAGLIYEKLEKYNKALEVYEKIKKEYDNSPQAASIDKYITRVNLLKK